MPNVNKLAEYSLNMNQKLIYWIDKNNIIQKVNDIWDSSMDVTNWSDRACSEGIIGKSLLEFICDDVTRMYVATMIDAVRVIPQTLFRPYRCDSPDTKRFMQMTITPEENGLIRVSHELLRCEPLRKTVLFKTTKSNVEPMNIQFIRCSLCNRLHRSDTQKWHEVDDLDLISNKKNYCNIIPVAYSICPDCANPHR
ncbi:MAG: hypothetical protein LM517_10745 [Nitrosomonas sp.]|nr:hypothetical protein [Nitrosomonas sp.]